MNFGITSNELIGIETSTSAKLASAGYNDVDILAVKTVEGTFLIKLGYL